MRIPTQQRVEEIIRAEQAFLSPRLVPHPHKKCAILAPMPCFDGPTHARRLIDLQELGDCR